MCEKNEDLQKACKYEGGEIFLNVASEIEIMPFKLIEKMKEWYKYYYHIWLPTQEQLQDIWQKDYNERPGSLAFKNGWIGIFLNWVKSLPDFSLTDFNELWLAFVMKEKYNKLWSSAGEKWVKAE